MKKTKKFDNGGKVNNQITKAQFPYGPDDEYDRKRNSRMADIEKEYRGEGRNEGMKRQEKADVASMPVALLQRAGHFVGDKVDDLDAYASKKLGMTERGARKAGFRQGLKDEGYKKGGKVSSASSRADGCAVKGKTKGTMIAMKNGGKC
jgi:hypothetical protein